MEYLFCTKYDHSLKWMFDKVTSTLAVWEFQGNMLIYFETSMWLKENLYLGIYIQYIYNSFK